MAKTLTNLETEVRTYLDESAQADWLDTEVDKQINNGYHRVITAVMDVYEEFYVVTTNWDSVADQQEYGSSDGVPTDMFKIRRLEINYDVSDSNSIPRRAKPVTMDAVLRDLGNSALGITVYRNPAYFMYGSEEGSSNNVKIGLIPEPIRAGTNAFKCWHVPYQADLSASGDTVNIPYPDRYANLISLYASAQLLRKGQQEEAVARKYLLEFEIGLEKMKQEIEDRISDDGKQIVDLMGNDVDFTNTGAFY